MGCLANNILGQDILDINFSLWKSGSKADIFSQPHTLVSLWDMFKIKADILFKVISTLQLWENALWIIINDPRYLRYLDDESHTKIKRDFDIILNRSKELQISGSQKQIEYIIENLKDFPIIEIHNNIKSLENMIEKELGEQLYLFVPPEDAIWFWKFHIFGTDISNAFSLSIEDINNEMKEAGTCYATSCHTACVFHAMRVLEHGLRVLAKDVELTFDIQQWYNIINDIEAKIREIAKAMPRGTAKNERLKFLSEAAKEFTYFKDGWRNYVSHGRSKYDGPQALSALNHVKAFMIHLSTRLSE
jgi:phage anti-repressor protein